MDALGKGEAFRRRRALSEQKRLTVGTHEVIMELLNPFRLTVDGLYLSSNEEAFIPSPIIRLASELKDFARDPLSVDPHVPVLSVYRGVYLKKDKDLFSTVRYDVTLVLPGSLGSEKNKTLSHYHNDFRKGLSYPEVYEVLYGTGHFLLQKPPERGGPQAILVEARAGEGVLIPPNYGHMAINPGTETLIYSNLICATVEPLLDEFRKRRGGVYYELADGSFEKNPLYDWNVELVKKRGDTSLRNLYDRYVKGPSQFSYLCDPDQLHQAP